MKCLSGDELCTYTDQDRTSTVTGLNCHGLALHWHPNRRTQLSCIYPHCRAIHIDLPAADNAAGRLEKNICNTSWPCSGSVNLFWLFQPRLIVLPAPFGFASTNSSQSRAFIVAASTCSRLSSSASD